MTTFGELIADLRRARGLSQDELAQSASVDRNSIARIEQGTGGPWRPRTALRVFKALAAPPHELTLEEATNYLTLAGLGLHYAAPPFVQSRIDADIAAEDRGLPVPNDPTSREMREVHRALRRLLDALGPAGATKVMDAVADGRDAAAAAPALPQGKPPPRQLTVVEPPKVPFPGAVEQVRRTYEVTTPPKSKPKAKSKKRPA